MEWNTLLRQNLAFQKIKKNGNLVNFKDSQGNCIIHSLLDSQDYSLLKEFLDSFSFDCNVKDEESGYTPLHRALFNGFLSGAISLTAGRGIDWNARDHEGKTALDLLISTLPVLNEKEVSPDSSLVFDDASIESVEEAASNVSWSVWSWGSNSNYLLGHSSEKREPSLVFPFKNKAFQHAIYFKDMKDIYPEVLEVGLSKYHSCIVTSSGIYMCGFGKKGRLGLGDEESVLKPVMMESLRNVSTVGLGPDHTLAVTYDGELWTWGNNEHGILGYQMETGSVQLLPRLVTSGLKKVRIVAAAGSKYHSAVISDAGNLYCWGSNKGQLGYKSSDINWTPRKVTNFPTQQMSHVAVTNTSTAVLTQSSEVYVFMNYEYVKVQIQTGPSTAPSPFSRRYFSATRFTKLTSGVYQYSVLTDNGEVYMWVVPSNEFGDSWEQQLLPQIKPLCVWKPQNSSLQARDVSIGIDSNVSIVTESGHVYMGAKRSSINSKIVVKAGKSRMFKFSRIPYLNNVRFISASSSGAYYAIRADVRQYYPPTEAKSLQDDMKASIECTHSISSELSLHYLRIYAMDNSEFFCHKAILASRSLFFSRLFKNGPCSCQCYVYDIEEGVDYIRFSHFNKNSIKMVLEYIYCGKIQKRWDLSMLHSDAPVENADNGENSQEKVYHDFNELVKLLELDHAELILYSNSSSHRTRYTSQFLDILTSKDYADVKFQLKNGDLLGHSIIITNRSPFFAAILGANRKHWNVKYDDLGRQIIDLRHINSELFSIVLLWIYGQCHVSSLFSELSALSVNSLLQNLIDLIAISEELLLGQFKNICSQFLSSFIHLGNIWELLAVSVMYQANNLLLSCLDFVCWNLETFFERNELFKIESHLIMLVEQHLKDLQRRTFSVVRGPSGFGRVKGLAIMAQTERKEKRREEFVKHNDSGLSFVTAANIEENVEYFTERPLRSRKNSNSLSSAKDDHIFDMEMDEIKTPVTPTKVGKSWRKFSFTESVVSSNVSSPSLNSSAPWITASTNENSKIDFREVMNSQVRPPAGKSPILYASPTRASSKMSPLMINDSYFKGGDRKSLKSQSPQLPPQAPSLSNNNPLSYRESPSYAPIHVSPGSSKTSPIMLTDSFQNMKIINSKMNQKERRRKETLSSPVSVPATIIPWQSNSPTQKSQSLKDIQAEELFKRQSLNVTTSYRPSLLNSNPAPVSWAHAARLSPGKK